MEQSVNKRVVELVEDIKSRRKKACLKAKSSEFLKTINQQGIQFASGNGMSLEELTDFVKKTQKSRK
jgi:hypothetical protein